MQLFFEPVWSWPWITVATIAMFAVILLNYPRQVRHLPPRWRRLLMGLRITSALILCFAMFRPAVEYSEADQQKYDFVVLFDKSRSMQTTDAPGRIPRREAIVQSWQAVQPQVEKLQKDLNFYLADFAETITPIEKPDTVADGNQTAIGKVLNDLREQLRTDRLAGVLILGDGAQRANRANDLDPLMAATRLLEERGAPIHTSVIGTSEMSVGGVDVAIDDLTLDQPVTFERKTVPVRMQVRMQGTAGRPVRVRLLMEDRTGKTLGQTGELKPIPLTSDSKTFTDIQTNENSAVVNVELSFVAEQPGDYKIAAEAIPLNDEVRTNNNLRETLITVRKGGLKVAYFDTLRIEQKFIRELNDSAKIQLDAQFIMSGRRANTSVLNPKLFEPGAYDVYMIGDVPADAFNFQGKSYLNEIAERVREGAGLAMIGGSRNFGAGGYAQTAIAEFLPVRIQPAEKIGPNDPPSQGIGHPLKMLPTRDGERKYLMQLSNTNNQRVWRQLPELSGAVRLVPKSGAVEILAESEQQQPLMIAAETGRSRSIALAIDETWKWHLHGHTVEHQRFWQHFMLWLARKEYESDQPVWVKVEPRSFAPLEAIPIEMGAQTAEGEPLTNAQFEVEVLRPDGTTEKLPSRRQGDTSTAEYTNADEPGDYWVRVSGTNDGQGLGLAAMTRFVVDVRDLEMDNPSADPTLMTEIASLTGGSVIPYESLGDFFTTLAQEGLRSELKRVHRMNLWDGWPLLLLFVFTMSLEWTIRKIKGLT